jgi:hypothetical protein
MGFRKGTPVRQVVPAAVEGVVEDAKFDADTGEFEYLVKYTTEGGVAQRWFKQDQVEALPVEGA